MKYRIASVFAAIGLIALATSTAAASTLSVPDGYKAEVYVTAPQATFIGGFDVDSSGNVYSFETLYEYANGTYTASNSLLNKYDFSSGITTTLYDFESVAWGAFVKVNGDEVVFGHTSDFSNTIQAISKSGGPVSDVYSLAGQYDIAYNSLGEMFISANIGTMYSQDNAIYHIYDDGLGIVCDQLIDVGGNSGPIEFDENDNLYYYGYYGFGSSEIVKIDAANIASAIIVGDLDNAELDSADWSTYCNGLSGSAYFQFDGDGDLFSTSYVGTIELVPGQGLLEGFGVVTNNDTMSFLGQMAFVAGTEDFEAHNTDGGTLYVLISDFDQDTKEYASTIYAITPTAAIPEPSTIIMMLGGLAAGAGCVVRRMQK